MAWRSNSCPGLDHLRNQAMQKVYEVPGPGELFDPAILRLGAPCKRNHLWDEGVTLRLIKSRKCPLCERIDSLQRQQRLRQNPEHRAKQAAYARDKRLNEGRPSRSKHGLPYTPLGDAETRAMRAAIKQAGKQPSVARLVYEQQRKHWQQHPKDRAEYLRQRAVLNSRWRYMTDESFRLYHRSKSKRRKAQQRGSTAFLLSPDQMWRRWVDFNHTCAYCGAAGDLQVEHVVPISKGGQHHLGNIVPACHRCNSSKRSSDAFQWYKTRSYYSEARWERIQSVLNQSQPACKQLSFIA